MPPISSRRPAGPKSILLCNGTPAYVASKGHMQQDCTPSPVSQCHMPDLTRLIQVVDDIDILTRGIRTVPD